MRPAQITTLGPFTIEYLHVTHSTIDCVALAIRTPVGVIIHTGDFKIDPTPVDGKPFDLHAFARYGARRRARAFQRQHQRRAPRLHAVRARRRRAHRGTISRARPKKSWFPAFPVPIHRIQQVIDIARAVGRKVAFVGRSMVDNVEIAHGLDKLRIPDGIVVRPQDIRGLRSQKARGPRQRHAGRAACPRFRASPWTITASSASSENDTVILSARIIPGNEKAIFRMIDHLFRRRVLVYYEGGRSAPIHVSGHASQEEMKILLAAGEAEIFHSVARRISAAVPPRGARRAGRRGLAARFSCSKAATPSNSPPMAAPTGANRSPPGACCVDSGSLEEIEEVVIRDRKHLSEDGVVVPIIAIDKHTGLLEAHRRKSSRAASCPMTTARKSSPKPAK